MKKRFFQLTLIIGLFSIASFAQNKSVDEDAFITANKFKIEEKSRLWSQMLRDKDISLVESIYDEHAVYLPEGENALYGMESIRQYWKASFDFLQDIQLDMKRLDGTKEVLYETGIVTARVLGQDGVFEDVNYKYANVWKLQADGEYKVVIDIFNSLPRKE